LNKKDLEILVCPVTQSRLVLKVGEELNGEIISGLLVSEEGREYPINNGIPDLTYPSQLPEKDENVRAFYDSRGDAYDANLHLTFDTHGEDENEVRNKFVDSLELNPSSRVLEVASGTGRDSEVIASRLGDDGQLCLTDISPEMLIRGQKRLAGVAVPTTYCLSNASYLPFPDQYFDAVYSFGALGEFSDITRCLAEMVRVSKIGAKIVVGDESIPPWLRETEFAKILITTNKQFLAKVPLDEMPVEARNVCLRWVIGGVFYLIDFNVGEGEPKGNFDIEIPGVRGGTLRTRYFGLLESVTPETKRLIERAREKKDVSMYQWLEEVNRQAALRDLGEEEKP
jgi:ubiquinone/menaquinone biosynthesis C-methylase UbiE